MSILAACAIFASSLALVSCGDKENFTPNPNNPKEQQLPAAKFSVKVCEEEHGVFADSLYRFIASVNAPASLDDGKVTFTQKVSVNGAHGAGRIWSINPDVVELVLTPYNKISFEMDADVNASSSSDVMDIRKGEDLKHYELKAVKDGDGIREGSSTIRFWNGDANSNAVTIRVRAANHVDIEGFEFRISDLNGSLARNFTLLEVPAGTTYKNVPYIDGAVVMDLDNIGRLEYFAEKEKYSDHLITENPSYTENMYDLSRASVLEFLGTVPRCATPDNELELMLDIVSFYAYGLSDDVMNFYKYNQRSCPEFRWLPFEEKSVNDFYTTTALSNRFTGKYATKIHPSDIRGLKAVVWNQEISKKSSIGFTYFWYRANNRNWWGVVNNEVNPNAPW